MADLSDVENAIVANVTSALYPNGVTQASAVGAICRVYRGWPTPTALNSDLAAGAVNVTIFPAAKPDEVPDPYFDTVYAANSTSSLAAIVIGSSVTFSGLIVANQIVGLLVDGVPYIYSVNSNDSTENIAANLAALIQGSRLAILSGSTFTVPGVLSLTARIVTKASVSWSLRRQRREVLICCWCPSAVLRDSVCTAIDFVLAVSSFISLADGTKAHGRYISTQVYDQSLNALLYRRDICYKFEYTLINGTSAPVMLFGDLINNGGTTFV
jgi:hypothetical protein